MRAIVAVLLLSAGVSIAGASVADTPAAKSPPAAPAAVPPAGAKPSAVKPITADELIARQHAKDAKLVVLDVRTPEEFAEGHVPGAVNVPHDQVEARLGELQSLRDKDVVLYCRSGRRAGMAAETLQKAGFTRLQHLEGDMQGWTAAGRPTAK
jgi:phage shock protein E